MVKIQSRITVINCCLKPRLAISKRIIVYCPYTIIYSLYIIFVIYINRLFDVQSEGKVISYADGTVIIVFRASDSNTANVIIERYLVSFKLQFVDNLI